MKQNVMRFASCISRSTNPIVRRMIDSGDWRGVAKVNKSRIWSPFDLLTKEFVEPLDGRSGFYTRKGCDMRVAALNAGVN